jgi:UDP-N-acetylglucosamine:LPS N-acetylglucosamine transferase
MSHIAIVSASVGAGHDGAAAELGRRLTAAGYRVDTHDLVELLPRPFGALLSHGYQRQVQSAPWLWHATAATFDRALPAAAAARATRTGDRRILAAVHPDTVAVISTYPLASQALGRLRRSGQLAVPVITYLTDPYVHRTWIADGVDATLAVHAATAAQARRLGARTVRLVAPAVAPGFRPAAGTDEVRTARRRFRLPPTGPLALIVAGSLGLGRPERTATDVLATGLATPVVACGRDRTLHQRLTAVPGPVPLGWTDQMPTLMRAVDVVIHNAGGLTSLEALATGLPTITYRPLAGHGRANAATLERAGIIPWVRDVEQLDGALRAALGRPDRRHDTGSAPDPAATIVGLLDRRPVTRVHVPDRQRWLRSRGTGGQPARRPPTRSHQ